MHLEFVDDALRVHRKCTQDASEVQQESINAAFRAISSGILRFQ